MRFVLTSDAEEFAEHAEHFLAERVERNALATVLLNARRGSLASTTPLFAYGLGANGKACVAALRTPPWPLLAGDLDQAAADALMDAWLSVDPAVPGVSGLPASARAVAAAWARSTGGSTRCRMREAIHLLREVRDPQRPARGVLRPATSSERDLLVEWEEAFASEAGIGQAAEAARVVEVRLANRAQFVWDDEGPVSTLALSPEIAGTVRIGPVYTVPDRRCRGYASSAVATAARRILAEGTRQCTLFTDLTNPTSNKIYAGVGFRRFANWEEHIFMPS